MKIKKIIGILLIISLIIFGTDFIMNKTIANSYEELSHEDKEMINQISEIYTIYNQNKSQLWSENYSINQSPKVITHTEWNIIPTKSYIIRSPSLEKSIFATEIKMPSPKDPKNNSIPKIYRMNSWAPEILIENIKPFEFNFVNIGNEDTIVIKYNINSLNDNLTNHNSFSRLLVHESFHEFYQLKNWKNSDLNTSSIFPENINIEIYQMFILENIILDHALKSNNTQEIKNYMDEWAVVRELRNEKYPSFKKGENVETLEGSAYYEESKFEEIKHNCTCPPILKENKTYYFSQVFENNTIDNFIEKKYLSKFMNKNIYYSTGASLCKIMDKLNYNWKEEVNNGNTIPNTARNHSNISKDKKELENSYESIKTKYNYNSYETVAEKIANEINNNP